MAYILDSSVPMRRAWWYMFALPVLLMVALYIVLYIISLVTIAVGGLVFNIVFSRFAGYYWDRGH
ncbi:Inner membrane protein yjgN ORF X [Salmonella enterica subsp. enterica]|uniref:Inner membrane protein yjgN ORF X n=1 Tax=Salmonella enterica I TaxID=59201 RepID=A0A447TNT7_SALET|nr:Inner membrane protein yjgN ORF X [Salmonella enterica subsp. enterica]